MPKLEADLPNVVLSFDFGWKRIGTAIGQSITKTANPLLTLKAQAGEPVWAEVDALIKKWRPNALLVGIPLTIEGDSLSTTALAKRFAESLRKHFNLPVYTVDERFTTVEARQQLFDSGGFRRLTSAQVDSWAAKLILESWFSAYKK